MTYRFLFCTYFLEKLFSGLFQLFLNVQGLRVLYLCSMLMFQIFSSTVSSPGPAFQAYLICHLYFKYIQIMVQRVF